jgi:hypothetical protein
MPAVNPDKSVGRTRRNRQNGQNKKYKCKAGQAHEKNEFYGAAAPGAAVSVPPFCPNAPGAQSQFRVRSRLPSIAPCF